VIPGLQYTTIGAAVLAFAAAAIAVRIARAVIHRLLDTADIVSAENRRAVHARAKQLIRALTLLAYGVAALASVSLALSRLGAVEPRWDPRLLGRWLLVHGINLVVIVVGLMILVHAAKLAIEHLQHKLGHRHTETDLEGQRRAATLGRILTNVVSVSAWFIGILMVLGELSIELLPILTGAGIAGLAIGFGAQNLVRDVISGFFLILEDQVRIGDLARINGVAGTVEQINLRTLVLRDAEGAVQVFPNGTITTLANLSKQFAYAIVDVRVSYTENIDRVSGTIREVGESMERDAVWGPLVLAPIEVVGVESLADNVATIRVKFKTTPLNQGRIANELRRRLVTTFVGRGIRPYAG